jgi:hypothetical protein
LHGDRKITSSILEKAERGLRDGDPGLFGGIL